jgi:hypothetical protein
MKQMHMHYLLVWAEAAHGMSNRRNTILNRVLVTVSPVLGVKVRLRKLNKEG